MRRRPGNGDLDAAMEHGSARATSGSSSRPWRLRIPRSVKPIGRGADPNLLAQELRSLPPEACLQQQGEFDVYELAASQAPDIVPRDRPAARDILSPGR